MYTIQTLYKRVVNLLKEAETETPLLDGEVIMMHFLQMDRLHFMTERNKEVDENTSIAILKATEARRRGRPVQYITGKQEFMGLEFMVEEGVLIPRGDTEVLVEVAMELCREIPTPTIIDMCTGSGAIAISLAYYKKDAMVIACDLSERAISCCKKNRNRYNLNSRVQVLTSDLFKHVDEKPLADMIISNPPYIETETIDTLLPNVRDYEPRMALDGGKDGLHFYQRITKAAKRHLKNGGWLIYEIGYNQAEAVKNILWENGYEEIQIKRDLANLDRCAVARYFNKQNEERKSC